MGYEFGHRWSEVQRLEVEKSGMSWDNPRLATKTLSGGYQPVKKCGNMMEKPLILENDQNIFLTFFHSSWNKGVQNDGKTSDQPV